MAVPQKPTLRVCSEVSYHSYKSNAEKNAVYLNFVYFKKHHRTMIIAMFQTIYR